VRVPAFAIVSALRAMTYLQEAAADPTHVYRAELLFHAGMLFDDAGDRAYVDAVFDDLARL